MRFKFQSSKHFTYLISKWSRPSSLHCNSFSIIFHFCFQSLQVDLDREFQALPKQGKDWNTLREVQASSSNHQAFIKLTQTPFTISTERGKNINFYLFIQASIGHDLWINNVDLIATKLYIYISCIYLALVERILNLKFLKILGLNLGLLKFFLTFNY